MDKLAQLTVDGRNYQIGYNTNSLCDAEDVCGCNLYDGMMKLLTGGGMTMKQLRGLLFAMIVPGAGVPKDDSELLKFCGFLIRADTSGDLIIALGEACSFAMSEELGAQVRDGLNKLKADIAAKDADDTDAFEGQTNGLPIVQNPSGNSAASVPVEATA
jgi:hypothetical protein